MAKSDWREINIVNELTQELADKYHAAKQAYREYKRLRDVFEQAMQDTFADSMTENEELKFGYNFGKLSIAVGEKRERKPKREAKPAQSFGDWLKAQREGGHNH